MADQVTDQVTDTQDQGSDQGDQASLGWRSALSDEFKENDFVKGFEKPTDFVKAALEIKTKQENLESKMEGAIFKPGEGATEEEVAAFRSAMGIPETPDDYEFPETEGLEQDEQVMEWARGTFHKAGLSKEQAALISQSWDGFILGMEQANEDASKEAFKTAQESLKTDWGADYDGNLELSHRAYKFFEDKIEGFKGFLEGESTNGKALGNHPDMIRAFHVIGKAMGEDISPKATPKGGEGEKPLGMDYESMDHFKD